jgi:hypothetical protein
VHLQLDADTFSPLQRSYDAKEVLGARVPAWPKHPLQARGGDLRFTGEFAKANRCVDVVTQDSAACIMSTFGQCARPGIDRTGCPSPSQRCRASFLKFEIFVRVKRTGVRARL